MEFKRSPASEHKAPLASPFKESQVMENVGAFWLTPTSGIAQTAKERYARAPMISITIDKLVKKFGDFTALDTISLRVEPGELFFLLGPSGCGKTTLLRSIAGFTTPESGRILFDNEDVTGLPAHQRNTGMMFQSYALWPHMTVEKNVAFGLEERRVPTNEIKQRVGEALELVRMETYAARKIAQLSGGQQQRVALARALVVRPRALLLDEPLSNLDARLRLEMRQEIRRVCKEFGLTAIYVTHDQKEALSISDRMAILDAGRIAQIGRPDEVYRKPQTKLVAEFIGETNFLPGKILSTSSGTAHVQTETGVFEGLVCDPDWKPSEGEMVTLSIRPESWVISSTDTGENTLRGSIGEAVYLGEIAQYQFVSGASNLKISELNPRLSSRPRDRDFFAFANKEDVVILRK